MRKLILTIVFLGLSFHMSAQSLIKVASANLNFRAEPKIENNIISVIPKGTLLLIDFTNQEFSNWIRFTYEERIGYAYRSYLVNPKSNYANRWEQEDLSKGSKKKYYINSRGKKVQSPTYYKSPPAGATAVCRDGTYSFSRSRRGTCSHHGGVKRWL